MDKSVVQNWIKDHALTFYIETYGCQMNAHDSEKIAGILISLGCKRSNSKMEADLILFNTCCVRQNAENKIFGNVGKLKQLMRQKPKADRWRMRLHDAATRCCGKTLEDLSLRRSDFWHKQYGSSPADALFLSDRKRTDDKHMRR